MEAGRPRPPAKLGLEYAALAPANAKIVCVHASAYGRGNERESWPGYDYLMQAEAGFLSLTGEPDAPPTRFGLSMVDYMTGQMLATTTLAGIIGARATGIGRDYDLCLLDTALHQTSYPATWHLNEGYETGRAPRSAHPTVTPSQLFRTADGWIFVMAQLPKFWTRLVQAIGAPGLSTDPRFTTIPDRLRNRQALVAILDDIFVTQPTRHWVDLLGGICPVSAVHNMEQAFSDPFILSRGMVQTIPNEKHPEIKVLASPILVDGLRLAANPSPRLGGDTSALLAEIGFSEMEIARFTEIGVV